MRGKLGSAQSSLPPARSPPFIKSVCSMVQPWLKLSCSCERQGPAPHTLGPTRNSPSSRAGLPPQDLTCLVEVDVKSVRCLNACFFMFSFH